MKTTWRSGKRSTIIKSIINKNIIDTHKINNKTT